MTIDDLTAAEKFFSYSPPGQDWHILIFLICLLVAAILYERINWKD